jgi:hypothetical protein
MTSRVKGGRQRESAGAFDVIPDWARYQNRLRELLKIAGLEQTAARFRLGAVPTVRVRYNWHPYQAEDRAQFREDSFKPTDRLEVEPREIDVTEEGEAIHRVARPILPAGVEAFATFHVPVTSLGDARDVEPILDAIKARLLDALKNRPTPDEAPDMSAPIPPQCRYLLHAHEDAFRRDLERFRLYQSCLSFREIAVREGKGPANRGKSPRTERSVSDSIKRTYEAIHLRPFPDVRSDRPAPDALSTARTLNEDAYVTGGVVRRKGGGFRHITGPEGADEGEEARDFTELASLLEAASRTLSPIERSILDFTYGRWGKEWQMSPEGIARRAGLSVERVNELKTRAEAKMRKALASAPPEDENG